MLALTPDAVEVIHGLSAEAGMPGTGLRIAPYDGDGWVGAQSFTLTLAGGPAPDDTVIEARDGGTLVYLEPEASRLLADQVLDARVDERGEIAFLISPQSPQAGPSAGA